MAEHMAQIKLNKQGCGVDKQETGSKRQCGSASGESKDKVQDKN